MAAKRVTIDLNDVGAKDLSRLTKEHSLGIADVFRFAFVLFRMYCDLTKEGREFRVYDPKTKETWRLVLPF